MKERRRWLVVFVLLVGTIALDQVTKVIAKATLRTAATQSFLADTFRLTYAENRGAFLSLGAALPQAARFWVLEVGVALVLVALLVHSIIGKKVDLTQAAAYALVVGGGLGNWIDRVLRGGLVVDFLNLGIGPVRTGVFNVADVAIMAGAALLLLSGYIVRPQPTSSPPPAEPEQTAPPPGAT